MLNLFNTGAFYYMLGNLQPKYRSTTRTIQLLAVAKTADLKQYEMDALLTPVIHIPYKQDECVNMLTTLGQ